MGRGRLDTAETAATTRGVHGSTEERLAAPVGGVGREL
ncbi:hypothetical protein KCH_30820 [Kitasatospora cheerisanensis KCTC 2395]|uniref:Uncharacterized protein n=1 Tax=Kitasatospora cheerisanensis KCTC 2395 TaxID=1348663 RepID=A0A066YTV3_9ACTN|nr:hypothetical protein KCH_30820 [Kitasatospora cheerisanensis KCTC 2395]